MDIGNLAKILVQNKGAKKFSYLISQGGRIQLTDPDSKMSVHLTDISRQVLAIKLPASQPGYFQNPYNFICDYFVIVPRDDGADVVLCEMKETLGKSQRKHAYEQIKCSIPLFWYIKEALTTHFGEKGEIRLHYAILAKQTLNAMGARTTHAEKHKPVDNIRVREVDGREIREIVKLKEIPLGSLYTAGE